ncbi:MAG: hypothetical protein Q4G04_05375 [bacterium]|nr:hypothetical protein [bacterium]
MQKGSQLDLTKNRIWKDRNIKPEYKRLYAYLYQKGFDKISFHINVGEIQNITHITNVGLRKCMKILEDNKYIKYIEYDRNLYEVTIC